MSEATAETVMLSFSLACMCFYVCENCKAVALVLYQEGFLIF